jgi:uncharacterized membrane protein YgcG
MKKMAGILVFFVVMLVILTIAPQVTSANNEAIATYEAASENQSMIGLGVIMPWGGFLIVMLILASIGIFTMKIKETGFNMQSLISPVIKVIIAVVVLTFYSDIITSVNTIMAAETNEAIKIVWGVILLAVYFGIITLAGGYETGKFLYSEGSRRGWWGGKKTKSSATSSAGSYGGGGIG